MKTAETGKWKGCQADGNTGGNRREKEKTGQNSSRDRLRSTGSVPVFGCENTVILFP